ncbi:hypothetical protein [Achromobacter xylosoxidans]|uniref:Uncharacterized protein n=1 Tax=Alcaligenes xylosoxydans xylosoxydans TaxID=85698 RepID=A0A424WAP6_ALCXX|nr:hypothetical protein [Achromobacter xylosoxidans]MBC9907341.1 hypothetical protein [Achromobacter xylosoxidans]MBD0870862.1 hypothetical protein [Achromobacter xylosoxidans]QNP88564.1 hypothetical protein IAG39_14070 [Achromobacter xylosoxidans]RPJ90251.1 hypothetical protein DY367_18860 [Achromobacter xylosoxidans]
MNDKTKTWRSTTTTRSWSAAQDLTPEQRANIEALLDGGMDGATVNETWSYAGTENGESFKVEIKNGAVTVNGRKYDSLDGVPRAERERIEALRAGQGDGGLWDMLRNAGVDVENLAPGLKPQDAKPEFVIETDDPAPTRAPAASAQSAPNTGLPPGAVPPKGGGLRRTLLIGVAIGLGWWVARALNLF